MPKWHPGGAPRESLKALVVEDKLALAARRNSTKNKVKTKRFQLKIKSIIMNCSCNVTTICSFL